MTKKIALVNNENVVVNIGLFEDDATDQLILEIAQANGAVVGYDVSVYGETAIGGDFYNNKLWHPKPFESWIRNEDFGIWEAPTPYPDFDEENPKYYKWNEELLVWEEILE